MEVVLFLKTGLGSSGRVVLPNIKVSDTTADDSSNTVGRQKAK